MHFRITDYKAVIWTVIAVSLLITLLVGWNLILVENYLLHAQIGEGEGRWAILSVGCVFFLVIMGTIVLLVRNLVRHKERNQFQTVLLDSVTHELKSPLSSIKMAMETLNLRELPEPKRRTLRTMVIEDIERLNALIEHMLTAGRLEHRRPGFDIQAVQLPETVARVVDQVRRRRGSEFEIEIDDERCPEWFNTDEPALEVVLFNLIDNAIKYSAPPAKVRLMLGLTSHDELEVMVSDRGFGLEKSQLKRVFGRFYRATSESTRRDGVGLGLFVVKALVRALGGKAWAESKGKGQGTTFRFVLPPAMTE